MVIHKTGRGYPPVNGGWDKERTDIIFSISFTTPQLCSLMHA